MEFLNPEGWFERGHDHLGGALDSKGFWRHRIVPGTFVWTPPPAAAEAALEELRKARIKRQDSLHIFACPRLMTTRWLKQLYKASDIVFQVPAGCPYWPAFLDEPLTIGLVFPFIRSRPWQLRRTPKMFKMGRSLSQVFKEEQMAAGDLLRKFLLDCRGLRSLPEHLVRRVLFFESRNEVPYPQGSRRRGGKRRRSNGSGKVDSGLGQASPVGVGLPPCKKRRSHSSPIRM